METFYMERDGQLLHVQVLAAIPPKICAHCGATFFVQEGRSLAGQHRSKGVKYCSSRHAKAAMQRAYRARHKA